MKARELMEELFARADEPVRDTVDTCKAGDPERALRRVATCFIATPEVIRAAGDWGADLLITHEPTYYEHRDHLGAIPDDPVMQAKKRLLEGTGMTTTCTPARPTASSRASCTPCPGTARTTAISP